MNRHLLETLGWLVLLTSIAAADSNAAERALEKVRIAVSSKSLGFLDTWAAKERGFYRKYGLDAEIIAMRPRSPSVPSRPERSITPSARARFPAAASPAHPCDW